eukprot:403376910
MNLNLDLLRVCETLENSTTNDEDRDLLTFIHHEKTNKLRQQEKYVNFQKWLEDNGVLHPGVDYPVAFGRQGQLIGMAARKDIPPQKAFLFVPQRLMISEVTVRNSKIAPLLSKHPEIFKHHQDAEYLVIIAFVWHELMKGEASFWYPYFQIINLSDLPMLWSDQEIQEFQDQVLQKDIQDYKVEYENEWKLVYEAFSKDETYDEYYPGISNLENKEMIRAFYDRAYQSVVTRCFGWGLPKTSMIPFADCINHHNVDSTYELIHKDFHQDINNREPQYSGPKEYYTSSKIEGDYSDFFNLISSQSSNPSSSQDTTIQQQIESQSEYQQLLGERKEWPKRTQNQMDKVYRRRQVASLNISEFQDSKKREIWDVDYLTTSDEEDNDTEEEDSSSSSEDEQKEQQVQDLNVPKHHDKPKQNNSKKRKPQPKDVVYKLVEQDPELSKRDLQARLLKLKNWKEQYKKFNQDNEIYDVDEDFSKWWSYFDDKVYYAMGAKFKTFYRKGDQLFNCYGLRNNRFLMINYGFCLRNNKYNSLGFKVFVNYKKNNNIAQSQVQKSPIKQSPPKKPPIKEESKNLNSSDDQNDEFDSESSSEDDQVLEEQKTSQHQKIIRLKREKLCEELLQYLRANMIFTDKFKENRRILASSPVEIQFELHIISIAISLLRNMLTTKYSTTLGEDKELMSEIQHSDKYRLKLALIHRINQKEILADQIKLLSILLRILSRVSTGMPLKQAYCMKVEDIEGGEARGYSEQDIVINRVRLRKYLREFNYYQTYFKRLDELQQKQDLDQT